MLLIHFSYRGYLTTIFFSSCSKCLTNFSTQFLWDNISCKRGFKTTNAPFFAYIHVNTKTCKKKISSQFSVLHLDIKQSE